jgi:hypothetical protein
MRTFKVSWLDHRSADNFRCACHAAPVTPSSTSEGVAGVSGMPYEREDAGVGGARPLVWPNVEASVARSPRVLAESATGGTPPRAALTRL